MSKFDQLYSLYERVLNSLLVEDVGEGMLSLRTDPTVPDQHTPATIDQKRLVMPTKERVKTGNWEGVIAFHPLSEHLYRGESEVLKMIKDITQLRLQCVLVDLTRSLLAIAADPQVQKKLTASQSKFLVNVKDADEKTLKALSKIEERHIQELVSIYLKKRGKIDGNEYRRVASVTFPIYQELQTSGSKVFSTDLGSNKVKRTIASALEVVLTKNGLEGGFSAPSSSDTAPYFQSLMRAYINVAKQLNKITQKYKKHLDNPDVLMIDIDFAEELENIDELKHALPPLEGNIGPSVKGEKEPTGEQQQKPASNPHAMRAIDKISSRQSQPQAHSPAVEEKEEPVTMEQSQQVAQSQGSRDAQGVLDWDSFRRKPAPMQQNVPLGQPAMMSQSMGANQQPMNTGGFPVTNSYANYGQPQTFTQPGFNQHPPMSNPQMSYSAPAFGNNFSHSGPPTGNRYPNFSSGGNFEL